MDKEQLIDLANDFLIPFIPGSLIYGEESSNEDDEIVDFITNAKIAFKTDVKDDYRIFINREQPFESKFNNYITEYRVIKSFVETIRSMKRGLSSWYHSDLRTAIPRRVIARVLSKNTNSRNTILKIIDTLSQWSERRYEGSPIVASIGFDSSSLASGINFQDICCEQFISVISNGLDTLLVLDYGGNISSYQSLEYSNKSIFSPCRYSSIANWTTFENIAIVLNTVGEILIFQNKQLVFAKRSGRWHFLTHRSSIKQIGEMCMPIVKKSVYETCLDVSFSRTGGCIGIVSKANIKNWKNVATSKKDYIEGKGNKSLFYKKIISDTKFQNLDRRLRKEILATDGAVLIGHDGTLLAIGAILCIKGGSEEGGRLAAAKALSDYGIGIKISQDGSIRGYHKSDYDEPSFRVM